MPLDRDRFSRTALWIFFFLIATSVSFLLDGAIASFWRQPISSNQTMAILSSFKCWGDGVTVVTLVLAIMMVAPNRRSKAAAIIVGVLLAAVIADTTKFASDRQRPFEMKAIPTSGLIWIPHGGSNSAFPSGHAASAFALARGISTLFPVLTPICIASASGTALSRMAHERHFLSDCVAGGFLGWLVMGAVFSLQSWLMVRWFRQEFPSCAGEIDETGDGPSGAITPTTHAA